MRKEKFLRVLTVSGAMLVLASMASGAPKNVYAEDMGIVEEVMEDNLYASEYLETGNLKYKIETHWGEANTVTIVGLSAAASDTNKNVDLVIPSEIDGYTVTKIESRAFAGKYNIKSVKFNEGLKEIGHGAFANCKNLAGTLELPVSLTKVAGTGYVDGSGYVGTFQGTAITKLNIKEGSDSLIIEEKAFLDCKSLVEVNIAGRVSKIEESVFENDKSLSKINITASDGSLTIGNYAFANTAVVKLTLPSQVTSIGSGAFYNCTTLESLALSEGLQTIGGAAFYNCKSLTGKLTLPASLTKIENDHWINGSGYVGAFQNTSITELIIKAGSDELSIGTKAFYQCNKLTSVDIAARVNLIDDNAFWSCVKLDTIKFASGNGKLVIGDFAFSGVPVKTLTFPSQLEVIKRGAFSVCTSLESIKLNEGLKTIGGGAFVKCSKLTGVLKLPTTLQSIDDASWFTIGDNTHYYGAFEGTALTGIEVEDSNQNYSIGDGTFRDCTSLTYASLSDRLSKIGEEAFSGDKALTWVWIKNGNYDLVVEKNAFNDCIELKAISLPQFTTNINDYAFSTCKSLKDVYYASNKTYYNDNVKVKKPDPEGWSDAEKNNNKYYVNATFHFDFKDMPKTIDAWNAKYPLAKYNGWKTEDGKKYWYENGEKQGVKYKADGSLDLSYRGKEIYDPESDAWYWLDCVQGGAMTVSKDVYQESAAGQWADKADGTGKWVRYDENGHMIKGWSGDYYFDEVFGTMAKGYATIDKVEYYFNPATGVKEKKIGSVPELGWKNIGGSFFWYENYTRQGYSRDASYRGKEIYDPTSDAWYWLDNVDGGKKAVGKDVYQESAAGQWADKADGTGKWVRYDANGGMIKGWQFAPNGTYYFDPIYGTMAKGDAFIDGQAHYFNPATGVMEW